MGGVGAGGGSGAGAGCSVGGVGGTTTGPTGGGIVMGGCSGCGVVEQALNRQTTAIREGTLRRVVYIKGMETKMWILMVEAGVALFLLVFIVWWTMFAGRKDVDRKDDDNSDTRP